jgi:hypothetical protein
MLAGCASLSGFVLPLCSFPKFEFVSDFGFRVSDLRLCRARFIRGSLLNQYGPGALELLDARITLRFA